MDLDRVWVSYGIVCVDLCLSSSRHFSFLPQFAMTVIFHPVSMVESVCMIASRSRVAVVSDLQEIVAKRVSVSPLFFYFCVCNKIKNGEEAESMIISSPAGSEDRFRQDAE